MQGAKNRDLLCNWRGAVLGWWRRQTRRGLLGKCSTRRRLVPWHNRNSRILAALAAGKVFNAAEGSIRRHKIYGSCWKVDVRMPETVWVPIKAAMGTVKSIQRYRKLFWFILGAADGRLAPFWKIHPFEKKRFSHLGTAPISYLWNDHIEWTILQQYDPSLQWYRIFFPGKIEGHSFTQF